MQQIRIKKLVLVICVSLTISLFYGCLERTSHPDSEKPLEEDNKSIQKLINNASPDEIIEIPKGIYHENIIINKSITLIGENKITTILNGGINFNEKSVVSITSDNSKISGFTIQNGYHGIDVTAHNVTIINNIIKTNSNLPNNSRLNTGITLYSCNNNIISKNVIINNSNIGIKLTRDSQGNNILRNSIINNNIGIYIENSSNNIISNNNFINNNNSAYDDSNNSWDDKVKGNYWSDYIKKYSNATKINESWNISYNIFGGNNSDRRPLINQINNLSIVNFSYTPLNPSTKNNIQFSDYSIDDGYIATWFWDFGDGTNSTIQNPTHKYLDNGYYTIFFNVTDNQGEINGTSKIINILNSPSLPNDLDNIIFNDKSFDTDGFIISWKWDFNDGNISYENNVSHNYIDNGLYTVTLTVKDDDGDSNSTSQEINILNISRDEDGIIVSWNWDFDDGTTSNEKSPNHRFIEGKYYKVYLTVIDDDGDSNTIRKDIIVIDSSNKSDEERGFIIIYVLFIIVFIIMIGVVIKVGKKYSK